jgi:hypothetical protein
MRRMSLAVASILLALSLPAHGQDQPAPAGDRDVVSLTAPGTSRDVVPLTAPGTARNFTRVGHNALFRRGMNAAPAIYKDFLYVGSRTDGSPGHFHPGVLVVNISDPANPRVVGEIDEPFEGVPSQTSRELRVWPQRKLLMVMNVTCSTFIHSCAPGSDAWDIRFFDLSNPRRPELVSSYEPAFMPHEMFLWLDPERPGRALLYLSTPHNSAFPEDNTPNLVVADISRARAGVFEEVAMFTANPLYDPEAHENFDVALHSMGVTPDGTRTYLAYLGGGFLVLDSSDLAQNRADAELRLLTPVANSPRWFNQTIHSAVKVPGRQMVVTTDEIYGDLLDDFAFEDHGCPWGWVHFIDVADPANPRLLGEYKIDENQAAYCQTPAGQDPANTVFTSFTSHNPTVLRNLALVTWHSGGVQAFRFRDPAAPVQTGVFSPTPLPGVVTEDVALSQGLNQVVMWSYPIIKNGLIYVIDIRNGLYVLRYTGPGARQVRGIDFYEGNSNLGDAMRLEGGS